MCSAHSLKSGFPVLSVLVLFFLISCVNATDDYSTLALRDTLSSLCEVNKEGKFGSCCRTYDISSVSIEESEAQKCFISKLTSTSDGIEYLFVSFIPAVKAYLPVPTSVATLCSCASSMGRGFRTPLGRTQPTEARAAGR